MYVPTKPKIHRSTLTGYGYAFKMQRYTRQKVNPYLIFTPTTIFKRKFICRIIISSSSCFFLALCLCPFFLLGERELSKRESDGAMEKWVKRWNKISIENLCLWHWCWSFIFDVVWCGLLVVVIFRFDSLTHSNLFLSLAFVLSICFAVFLLLLFHSLTFNASFGSIAMVAATKIDELFVFSALMLFSMSIF